jgi:lipoate-protein ligase A
VGTSSRKVKGGKYLRVNVEHDGSVVNGVKITGDFFFHPEDKLSLLESELVGTPIDESDQNLAARIGVILSENRLTVLGFGPADLAALIKEAGT